MNIIMHYYMQYTLIFLNLSLFSIIKNESKLVFHALNFINDITMHFYLEYTLIFLNLSIVSYT